MKNKEYQDKVLAMITLENLPKTIQHSKLDVDCGVKWEPCSEPWNLILEPVYPGISMHESNSGLYRIAYVLSGWEGENQALPYLEPELSEIMEYDYMVYSGGIYGNSWPEVIMKMKDWLEKENLI